MTRTDREPVQSLDDISFTIDRVGTSAEQTPDVRSVYASVYAEPPYCENTKDVDDFVEAWARRQMQPGFRLVVASRKGGAVGFTFGHELPVGTRWWSGPNTFTSADVAHEYPGRTFAIIELAVLKPYRRHGIGRELHTLLLAGLRNERVTLLVRPEAEAAQASYRSWGYDCVGRIQPFDGAPVYDAMILHLAKHL
jgi:ribosomal protein S18 acetylase RimI-like enzyme